MNLPDVYVIQGWHNVRMGTVMRTVKLLSIRLDNLRLDVIINLMRCFPCMEELYIKVTTFLGCLVSNIFLPFYYCTFVILKLDLIILIWFLGFSDRYGQEKH